MTREQNACRFLYIILYRNDHVIRGYNSTTLCKKNNNSQNCRDIFSVEKYSCNTLPGGGKTEKKNQKYEH
jgi:hypothetical protein